VLHGCVAIVPIWDAPICSCTPLPVSGSLERKEYSESMIARFGGSIVKGGGERGKEGERLTASCREGMIDEPNGELDLLVKARQPTCSCNARSASRLYIYVRKVFRDDSGGRDWLLTEPRTQDVLGLLSQ
jgi:hypothetical protein